MKPEYQEWINVNVLNPMWTCHEVAKAMAEAFPELHLVRGHYHCWVWGKREHWWLEGDEMVDPTAAQFPSKGEGSYVEWDDSQPEPTGKCPNCGEYCFNGDYVHDHCHNEFLESL